MATVVNIHEAKSTLSKLLEQVAAGERVIIARAGKPVAELVPHARTDLVFGTAAGQLAYDDATFDDPDEDLAAMFERG